MPQLRDGTTVDDIRLDRIVEHDERNAGYPVRTLLAADQREPVTKQWRVGKWLDQGQEGACVGAGFAHDLAATPMRVDGITMAIARERIYWEVQKRDPLPGGAYPGASPRYEGTSVLSGAKYLHGLGAFDSYHWAQTEPELAAYVSHKGPAILGLNWHEGMYRPDAAGFLRPTGAVAGGHCILAAGINVEGSYFTLHNSWGKRWGDNGTAKVSRADMAALLADNGEACCPVGRKKITI